MRPVPVRSHYMSAVQIHERRVGTHVFLLLRVARSPPLAQPFHVAVRQHRFEHCLDYQKGKKKEKGIPLPIGNTGAETSLPSQIHPAIEGKINGFSTVEPDVKSSMITTGECNDEFSLILHKSVCFDMRPVQR